jgi:hypothetical protein
MKRLQHSAVLAEFTGATLDQLLKQHVHVAQAPC